MTGSPRVLIADDSADLRAVVRSQLEHQQIIVVAEAQDGASALARAGQLRPDVVVLDAAMPGADVAAVLAALAELRPPPGVVVYSGWPAAELAHLGVSVVAKSGDLSLLVGAIRRAADNRPGP